MDKKLSEYLHDFIEIYPIADIELDDNSNKSDLYSMMAERKDLDIYLTNMIEEELSELISAYLGHDNYRLSCGLFYSYVPFLNVNGGLGHKYILKLEILFGLYPDKENFKYKLSPQYLIDSINPDRLQVIEENQYKGKVYDLWQVQNLINEYFDNIQYKIS